MAGSGECPNRGDGSEKSEIGDNSSGEIGARTGVAGEKRRAPPSVLSGSSMMME
jgi:hypothetical protein